MVSPAPGKKRKKKRDEYRTSATSNPATRAGRKRKGGRKRHPKPEREKREKTGRRKISHRVRKERKKKKKEMGANPQKEREEREKKKQNEKVTHFSTRWRNKEKGKKRESRHFQPSSNLKSEKEEKRKGRGEKGKKPFTTPSLFWAWPRMEEKRETLADCLFPPPSPQRQKGRKGGEKKRGREEHGAERGKNLTPSSAFYAIPAGKQGEGEGGRKKEKKEKKKEERTILVLFHIAMMAERKR